MNFNDTIDKLNDIVDCKDLCENLLSITLDRSGRINCPWHGDGNPSCIVNEKNVHCFACGVTKGCIELVSKVKNISRTEAIKMLCDYYGIDFCGQCDEKKKIRLDPYALHAIGINDIKAIKDFYDYDDLNCLYYLKERAEEAQKRLFVVNNADFDNEDLMNALRKRQVAIGSLLKTLEYNLENYEERQIVITDKPN